MQVGGYFPIYLGPDVYGHGVCLHFLQSCVRLQIPNKILHESRLGEAYRADTPALPVAK